MGLVRAAETIGTWYLAELLQYYGQMRIDKPRASA
jgi:hypothetical protein